MASQFSGQSQFGGGSQFSNSFLRTQAGDPTRFGLVNSNRQPVVRETVHPWILQAQQNALGQVGLLGGSGFGSGSGSSTSPPVDTSGYDKLSQSLMGQVDQLGGSQTQKINQAYDTSLDSSIGRLYDRGFGNSSLIESTQQQNMTDRQSALTELQDSLLSQKIGIGSQIGLAGLNAANSQRNMQQQFQFQLLGNLMGGMFG